MTSDTNVTANRYLRWTIAAVALCATVFILGRFFNGFEDDDMQHLHAAWLVGGGLVPYRDYFDHHMPLFHILFATYARTVPPDPLVLLVSSRLLALLPAAASLWLFARLAPRSISPLLGPLAALLFIVSRHADLIAELRPDYCALPCALAAIVLLAEGRRDSAAVGFAAGMCAAVATLFTQKILALLPAFVIWQAIAVIHAPRPVRTAGLLRFGALLAGLTIPLAALVIGLAHVGALQAFLAGPIGFGAHWVQPEKWPIVAQEPVLIDFAMMVPGLAWALRSTWLWLRRGREDFRGDGLLGLLAILGLLGFLKTPAPTEQAFLLVAQVWIVACAVRGVAAWVWRPDLALAEERLSRLALAIAAVCSLAMLHWYNMLIALILSALMMWGVRWALSKRYRREVEIIAVFAVLASVPGLVAVGTSIDRMRHAFVWDQMAGMRTIDSLIPPGSRVLTTWPVYTPLHPHATYHWFSDPGMYLSTPPGMLLEEYTRAMDDPRTSMVICEPPIVQKLAPEVMRRIRQRFVEWPLPRPLGRTRVFLRPGAPGHAPY